MNGNKTPSVRLHIRLGMAEDQKRTRVGVKGRGLRGP